MQKGILGVTEKSMKYNKKTNTYTVVYRIANGKRNYRYFKTQREAEVFKNDFLIFAQGKTKKVTENDDGSTQTQIGIMRCWLELEDHYMALGELTESTLSTYRATLISGLTKEEKNKSLELFDLKLITEIKIRCKQISPTGNKFSRMMIAFKKIQQFALLKSYIPMNVDLSSISTKKIKVKKPQQVLTLDDYKKLTGYAMDLKVTSKVDRRKAAIAALNMELGLRIGELAALRISDIDLNKKTVTVQRTVTMSRDGKPIMGEKTKSGKTRIVKLFQSSVELINLIISLNKELKIQNPLGLLVPPHNRYRKNRRATDFYPGASLARYLVGQKNKAPKYLRKLGIPRLNSHNAFRKTMATNLAENAGKRNVPMIKMVKTIQGRLGHSQPSTTMDNYIKPEDIAIDELESIFNHVDQDMISELEDMSKKDLIEFIMKSLKK